MSRKSTKGQGASNNGGKDAPSRPTVSVGQFMPNFGVDIPLQMNMKPALAHPGAPGRPAHPAKAARRPAPKMSPGLSRGFGGGFSGAMFGELTSGGPLGTPPPPGQKSKAGIPPPPSHGSRSKAAPLSSVKLNSLGGSGADSPNLLKAQPLPKIGTKKSASKQKPTPVEEPYSGVELVLYGHITKGLPQSPRRLVRIFLSSTFSDMKAERNEIWTTVYPAVRSHCISHDLDFGFVDMRWGVLDYVTDRHKTESVVLSEVQRTIDVSCATSFLSIIGHRYGSVVNESSINCERFDVLLETAEANNLENIDLLEQWYTRDDNNIPAIYLLKPISKGVLDYRSPDEDKKAAAAAQWYKISQDLYNIKFLATKLAVEAGKLKPEELENMEKSVTTTEIEAGIIRNPQASGTTYGIYRRFEGIEDDVELPATARFIDVETKGDKTVVNDGNLQKISMFITEPIFKVLPLESRKVYNVPWHAGGIPTDVSQQIEKDRKFLSTMSQDLIDYLTKAADVYIDSVSNEPKEYKIPASSAITGHSSGPKHVCTPECMMKCAMANRDGLMDFVALMLEYKSLEMLGHVTLPAADYKEMLHHLQLAEVKTRIYCGRKEQLAEVCKYVRAVEIGSPLMVYGSSGGGKTPFAAQVAKMIHNEDWLGKRAVVAVRFLGSTTTAELLSPLIRSLMVQLSCAYQIPFINRESDTLKQLNAKLKTHLNTVSFVATKQRRPCVIVLDGLEHLSHVQNAHLLTWIPSELPPLVHLITTFNASQLNLLATAQTRFSKFLELPPMTLSDMVDYLDRTLEYHNRTLTSHQKALVLENLKSQPHPVYAMLLANLSLETPSFLNISKKFSASIEEALNKFLARLELRYGTQFVTYCLSYITCGHTGISETELEDVLSCTDDVLIEVYVYHEPPVPGKIRIPPHLWPMLRNELNPFLIEKSTNNYKLFSWYHGVTEEAISKRYLSNQEFKVKCHKNLAEIYMSPKGVHRTITLTQLRNPLTVENADRQIASYRDTSKIPARALFSITHHLTCMNNIEMLKKMTICNLGYISGIWLKFGLKTLSVITNNIIQDLQILNSPSWGDGEITSMLEFFDNHLTSFGSCSCNEESLIDLCIIILGAFSTQSQTPCINILLEKVRDKLNSNQRPLIIPTEQCSLFGQEKLRWQLYDCSDIGGIDNDTTMVSLVSANRRVIETVDLNESKTYSLTCKSKILQVRLREHRLFALTDQTLRIQSFVRSPTAEASIKADCIAKGDYLNKAMAVSESARLICLGGKDRLAVLEDETPSADNPQYKAISSLALGGVKSTEAVVFTSDEKYTISAHTIAAKNKSVGGLVKWDYHTKITEARLSLPSPILKGCLHLLSVEDQVLCACNHNEILLVSMKEQKIVEKLYNGKASWISLSLDSSLFGLVFDNSDIKIWNLVEKNACQVTSTNSPTVVCVSESLLSAFVGNKNGSIEIIDVKVGKIVTLVQISMLSIISLKIISDTYLLVHDADNDLYIFDIYKLMEQETDSGDRVANSLGNSQHGMFSADGGTLLVERSVEEPASVFSTTDLTKVDISASVGCKYMKLCGGASYLVGENADSLKLWDTGKGAETIPPTSVKELCDSLLGTYYVSPSEPVVILSTPGMLTLWDVSSSATSACPYVGTNVGMIKLSPTLIALSLRSGTRSTENYLVHLIDRKSGTTKISAEREEPICDIQCNDETALFICSETCHLMSSKDSTVKELEFSSVQHIASSSQYYVIVHSGKTVALINGQTGSTLCSADIGQKVSTIVFTSNEYTLISLPLGYIQLIKWQGEAHAMISSTLTNKVQVTCGHISAYVDRAKQVLLVYGRLLDESRLFTFDLKRI